ncbi:TolC family protein [Aurantiacibacter flavus]|uniref:TolC family protein n=1 Tax=Aurantiacibacter flavus TaxID=3145232 RepID=A0ABV0CZD1_9SPHN
MFEAYTLTRRLHLPAAALCALLGACSVGPKYQPPAMEAGAWARSEPSPLPRADDPAFWRNFGDSQLIRLVEAALRNNRDIREAVANYDASRALLRQTRTEQWPTLSANATVADRAGGRGSESSSDQSAAGTSGEVTGSASWELDLFGRIGRMVEAQEAEAEASAADVAAVQVAVVQELANAYFEMCSLNERLRIARVSADNQARTLRMLQLRYEAGEGMRFDVDRGRGQLETTRSLIPALEARIGVAEHRIAVLTGRPPASLVGTLQPRAFLPGAMTVTPQIDAPGTLLRRRPDVAAAERRLAAATARIGVATADLFPRFSLSGLLSLSSIPLFEADSTSREISLGASGGFLNVARVRGRIAEAEANTGAALAAYERTVLLALEETENALIRISIGKGEVEHLNEAVAASRAATAAARARFDAGRVDVLDLLNAERASLQAQDTLAQARLRLAHAHLGLFIAMAGGWPDQMPDASPMATGRDNVLP